MKDKNAIWIKEDGKFKNFEKNIKVPNNSLSDVKCTILKNPSDFENIPKSKGVYWIWTNEPIIHILHEPTKSILKKIKIIINNKDVEGEIIYNGVAQDNIYNRIKNFHLYASPDNGISGISVDVYMNGEVKSHKKKILSKNPKEKVPYINNEKIKTKDDALKLFLSEEEKEFIKNSENKNFYFRNGINIFEKKHKKYNFIVFYIGNLKSESYMGFIEKQWRKTHKIYPRLCSYSSGR